MLAKNLYLQDRIQMSDNEYRKALAENPELYWHPEFINSPDCPSRDFKYMENY